MEMPIGGPLKVAKLLHQLPDNNHPPHPPPMSALTSTQRKYANGLIDFIHSSPTPFHAVSNAKAILLKAGFTELPERESWHDKVQRGKKYFVSRNGSSLIAFGVGGKWEPGKGTGIIGAHTDSPVLRVKPVSKRIDEGYLTVGVETYGGGIWHSWFDRDLSLAGRILFSSTSSKHVTHRLIHLEKPLIRIPTLAIHLDRTQNDAFKFNRETEFRPIAGLVESTLNTPTSTPDTAKEGDESNPTGTRHHSELLDILSDHVSVPVEGIKDFELVLCDTQPPTLGGMNDEFIFAPRLDNLCMSFCAVKAIEESTGLEDDETVRLISLFDHEEIGSLTTQGADSNFLPTVLSRLSALPASKHGKSSHTAFEESLSKSFLVSADMAHAVHPSYAIKYEDKHKPKLNHGVVLKINANARYATNSPGIVLMDEIARRAGKLELQRFVVRNDSSCGSTIGPMLAAKLGLRTVDLGNPQLSMHSCRETGGSKDVESAVRLFKAFFEEFGTVEMYVYGGELML